MIVLVLIPLRLSSLLIVVAIDVVWLLMAGLGLLPPRELSSLFDGGDVAVAVAIAVSGGYGGVDVAVSVGVDVYVGIVVVSHF